MPEAASEQFMAVQAQHHSGPLPAPQTLAGYESVLPGSAERILVMAEKPGRSYQAGYGAA